MYAMTAILQTHHHPNNRLPLVGKTDLWTDAVKDYSASLTISVNSFSTSASAFLSAGFLEVGGFRKAT